MHDIMLKILEKMSLTNLDYDKVYKQGLNINTPINLDLQKIATNALRDGLKVMIKEKDGEEHSLTKKIIKNWNKGLEKFRLEKSINWELAISKKY